MKIIGLWKLIAVVGAMGILVGVAMYPFGYTTPGGIAETSLIAMFLVWLAMS